MPTLQSLYLIAITLCVVSVSRYGQRDEWAALAGVFLASIVSPIVERHQFESVEIGILAVDLALLAWLTAISLRSNRYWPLFAAGFHLAGCSVHLAPIANSEFAGAAYGYAATASAYFVLSAIAVGSVFEARPRASDGAGRSAPNPE